jgi:hypothetical protein
MTSIIKRQEKIAAAGRRALLLDLAQMNDREVLKTINEIRQIQADQNTLNIEQNSFDSSERNHDDNHSRETYQIEIQNDNGMYDAILISDCSEDQKDGLSIVSYTDHTRSTSDEYGIEMLYDSLEGSSNSKFKPNNFPIRSKRSADTERSCRSFDDKHTSTFAEFCSDGFGCVLGSRRYDILSSSPASKMVRKTRSSNETRLNLIDEYLLQKIRSKESSLMDESATFDDDDGDDADRLTYVPPFEKLDRRRDLPNLNRMKDSKGRSTPAHSGCKTIFEDFLHRLTGLDDDDDENETVLRSTRSSGNNQSTYYLQSCISETEDGTKLTYNTIPNTGTDDESMVSDSYGYKYPVSGAYSASDIDASESFTRFTADTYCTNEESGFTGATHTTRSTYTSCTSDDSTSATYEDTIETESQTQYTGYTEVSHTVPHNNPRSSEQRGYDTSPSSVNNQSRYSYGDYDIALMRSSSSETDISEE